MGGSGMHMESAAVRFMEATAHGIRGQRLRWEPISPEDWRLLFRLAETQKLLPMVVEAVCECANAAQNPVFWAYSQAAKRQVVQQARQDAAFLPLYRELRKAGIPVLVVKGSICRSVYPNGGLRISADEDLLAEETQFPKACQVLRSLGLRPNPTANEDLDHEIGWHSPDGLLCLELHKSLFAPDSGPFGLLQTVFSNVFDRAASYRTELGELLSLSPHDHLLYLLLHAMKHFIRTGFGLRQVSDIGLWAERFGSQIDWPLLHEQCSLVHALRFCGAVFSLTEQLGITPRLPALWQAELTDPSDMLADILDGGIYGSSTMARQHTARITQDAVAAQQQGKHRSLRTTLFPPASALERDYPILTRKPALLPIVWQRRLIDYLKQSRTTEDDHPSESLRLGRHRLALLKEYGILDEI